MGLDLGRRGAPRVPPDIDVDAMIIVLTLDTILLAIGGMLFAVFLMTKIEGMVFKIVGAGVFLVALSLLLLPAEFFGLIPRIGP
jgi:hypothetical protein